MYSKEEAREIKRAFWIAFADAYPRKWMLHNTKIKDVSLKFYVDNKKAQVLLDIEPKEEEKRKIYFEKLESLQNILREDFLEDVIFEKRFYLDTGKEISRIWVNLDRVSVFNPKTWPMIFDFFNEKMSALELFFYEYEDYIKDLDINT